MEGLEIQRLTAGLDWSTFDCDEPALNDYLRRFALGNQERRFSVTYAALSQGDPLGYVTLAPSQIASARVIGRAIDRPRYPLPVLNVARLAVDRRFQQRGVGTALLRYALQEARRMADEFGCVGVTLDAKPEAITYYKRFGFVILEVADDQKVSGWTATPMFLPLNQIEDALR